MVVTMTDVVFWDMTPCSLSKNCCFRGTLKVEAICFAEMLVLLTRAPWHHIPEGNILHLAPLSLCRGIRSF
jgi:hypothetical protein